MSRLVLYMSMSPNGFIAGPADDKDDLLGAGHRRYRHRMGWAIPWYSCEGSEFNADMGVTSERGDTFGLSVFLRDGESVFRTYFTSGRGVEALGSMWTVLDLTPRGRQETWEDSPPRWPLTPPYRWWRRHDEYEQTSVGDG